MVFDPKFNQQLPTEQMNVRPVPATKPNPSAVQAAGNLNVAAGAVKAIGGLLDGFDKYTSSSSSGPKKSDIEDAHMQGFLQEYGDVLNSVPQGAEGVRKKKQKLRQIAIAAGAANPAIADKIGGLIKQTTGVDIASDADNFAAQQAEAQATWVANNPALYNQALLNSRTENGSIDPNALNKNVMSLMIDQQNKELQRQNLADQAAVLDFNSDQRKALMTQLSTDIEVDHTTRATQMISGIAAARDLPEMQNMSVPDMMSQLDQIRDNAILDLRKDLVEKGIVGEDAQNAIKRVSEVYNTIRGQLEANMDDQSKALDLLGKLDTADMVQTVSEAVGFQVNARGAEGIMTQLVTITMQDRPEVLKTAKDRFTQNGGAGLTLSRLGGGSSLTEIVGDVGNLAIVKNNTPQPVSTLSDTAAVIEGVKPETPANMLQALVGDQVMTMGNNALDLKGMQTVFSPKVMGVIGAAMKSGDPLKVEAATVFSDMAISQFNMQLSKAQQEHKGVSFIKGTDGRWEAVSKVGETSDVVLTGLAESKVAAAQDAVAKLNYLEGTFATNGLESPYQQTKSRINIDSIPSMSNKAPADLIAVAETTLGMDENDQNEALMEYLSDGGGNIDPAKTAWCASWMNATLKKSGLEGTGKLNARSFLDWGVEVDQPVLGDIVVFERGNSSWQGHVGIFKGYDKNGNILVLGGNQGNKVSVKSYSADKLLGVRRPEGMTQAAGTEAAVVETMKRINDDPNFLPAGYNEEGSVDQAAATVSSAISEIETTSEQLQVSNSNVQTDVPSGLVAPEGEGSPEINAPSLFTEQASDKDTQAKQTSKSREVNAAMVKGMVNEKLTAKQKRQLKAAGVNVEDVEFFETAEEAEAALAAGEVEAGTVYVDGQGNVFLLE